MTPNAIRIAKFIYRKVLPAVTGKKRPYETDFSAAVPFNYTPAISEAPGSIAAICHIFYADLAPYMRSKLENIPFPVDLYISTDTEDKRAAIAAAFTGWGRGSFEIRLCPNKGRDIAPKFVTFSDVYARYDLVLFVHSKKASTPGVGVAWRDYLMDANVGSPEIVRSIMEIFAVNPKIGIVTPQHFKDIRHFVLWDRNYRIGRKLGRRMGIAVTPMLTLDMPSGSMFWARTGALRPILDLKLRYEDFPAEKGQFRRTIMHAIERLFLFSCENAGYDWMKVAAPSHYDDISTIVPLASRDELRRFMAENCVRLLPVSRQ